MRVPADVVGLVEEMMPRAEPFSFRPSESNAERLQTAVAATNGEVSKSEIINIALDHLFAQVVICPSMIPGYSPERDKSVTHKEKMSYS